MKSETCCTRWSNKMLQGWMVDPANTQTSVNAEDWRRLQLYELGWHEPIVRSFDMM